jgi:hypothetical protein
MMKLPTLNTPTSRVALATIVIALAGGIVYAVGWARAWMPNVVVGALTVAVTVTVIERAFQREAEDRLKPRRDDVWQSLSRGLRSLIKSIAADYGFHHLDTFEPIPENPAAIIDHWLAGRQTEDAEDSIHPPRLRVFNVTVPVPDWSAPPLVEAGERFAALLNRERERNREVIDPRLIHAIDEFGTLVDDLSVMLEQLGEQDFALNASQARQCVVEATRAFALEFERLHPGAVAIEPFARKWAAWYSSMLRKQRDEDAQKQRVPEGE